MSTARITVNSAQQNGNIKPMQAVNHAPIGVIIPTQNRNNFEEFKAAQIPFARNHDMSEWIDYGGEFAVDVYNIFPNFDADPSDPANYEFAVTDAIVKFTVDTGTDVFYRLGSRIEHQCKKYRTKMPKDFQKWAVVCEHIISHYNEGWADGFHYGIRYWEIWNEPDLDPDGTPENKRRTWGGTAQEFYEFYATVATHLKSRFPKLKIGGPAVAGFKPTWLDGFFNRLTRDRAHPVPLDFFSWHWYGTDPQKMVERARLVREKLDAYGYTEAESHLNEWNYVENWREKWIDTIHEIIGIRGAAFIAACMCTGQRTPDIDMMMYYCVGPTTMNGIFDFYTCKPIKGYYAISAFSDLYDLGWEIETASDDADVYCVGASDDSGNEALLVVHYPKDKSADEKTIVINFENCNVHAVEIHLVDDTHDYTVLETPKLDDRGTVTLTLKANAFAMIKRKA